MVSETDKGCRIVEAATDGSGMIFLIDGTPVTGLAGFVGMGLFGAQPARFSPDGQREILCGLAPGNKITIMGDGALMSLPWAYPRELPDTAYFSPDGKHYVVARTLHGFSVAMDNMDRTSEEITPPQFSPDNSLEVHFKKDGARWRLMVNDKPGDSYEEITNGQLTQNIGPRGPQTVFSADSKHYGFVATESGQSFAVVDGKAGDKYPAVTSLTLSADGAHQAFAAKFADNKFQVVVDGKPQKAFTNFSSLLMSSDGLHTIYLASRSKSATSAASAAAAGSATTAGGAPASTSPPGPLKFAVVDGVEQPVHIRVSSLVSSPSGAHTAYTAMDSGNYQVVVDGKPGPVYAYVGTEAITFSPDEKHFAYPVWEGDPTAGVTHSIVVDGVAKPNPGAGPPQAAHVYFSPDSQHTAYLTGDAFTIARSSTGTPLQSRKIAASYNVVIDGVMGPPFDIVAHDILNATTDRNGPAISSPASGANSPVVFSLDGKHSAYQARKNGKEFVVIDQVPQKAFDQVVAGPVRRSDGALEYLAGDTRGSDTSLYRVVVAGFSPASK